MSPTHLLPLLADPTRLRCVTLLAAEGELCVCELTAALEVSQPKVSRHLAPLRDAGVVEDRRAGRWIHYRLHPTLPGWALRIIHELAAATASEPPFTDDRTRLAAMAGRPERLCCPT
ncbi:MAG: transcriptional regulator [Nitrospirae bacterium CG18_big_fil_WC_8_21_14_2_50_70_55]|nr:metalloregulator ArsR/SmtB family transcription factor [Deltaproteobacteria bacterium]OIP64447.1 MAG: transcriptional regulator [Nitrospirae bacterium CG2_30_70_394]PIQ05584.1 MAG: transcriptional regulator [Nitrospirae bacterium CG18_big_fil_WC_8_21_14_2_50_70_55]PIU77442.1 MAG: transcriptional regulator [Nitrospirae bacterium CG06_land_8_20_14_3_00_70_43]PIW83936.1 MAG: transcriptional regulator [Nitrospirae bacterium CG_4_8_14_3_um_filter_70_85]PIX82256.1 MAG: transcriptional regulator [